MNLEAIKKRIQDITQEEEQWLDETAEKAEKLDQLYNKEYRLICADRYDLLHRHSKRLQELTKKQEKTKATPELIQRYGMYPGENTNPCGPKCPNFWEVDCNRNPDSITPCQLPHRQN